MVGEFIVYYIANGERITDYIQALNAQQAADFARELFGATEVIEVAKVMKSWK